MINEHVLLATINKQIKSFRGSITSKNKRFVDGVIYGLVIAKNDVKSSYSVNFPLQEDNYERD